LEGGVHYKRKDLIGLWNASIGTKIKGFKTVHEYCHEPFDRLRAGSRMGVSYSSIRVPFVDGLPLVEVGKSAIQEVAWQALNENQVCTEIRMNL
jgi:hypothetical protein